MWNHNKRYLVKQDNLNISGNAGDVCWHNLTFKTLDKWNNAINNMIMTDHDCQCSPYSANSFPETELMCTGLSASSYPCLHTVTHRNVGHLFHGHLFHAHLADSCNGCYRIQPKLFWQLSHSPITITSVLIVLVLHVHHFDVLLHILCHAGVIETMAAGVVEKNE